MNILAKMADNRPKLNFITPKLTTVLEFFASDPMTEYYVREVSKKANVSLGSANKILKTLTALEFLTQERKGRMLIFRLNLKEPSVKQFKILLNVFTLKPLTDKLKAQARKIILFGSCSQGTDVKDSDIDLMILTTEKDAIKRMISWYNQKNDRKIAAIIANANEYSLMRKEDKPLYENIDKGFVLWEAEQTL